MDEFYQLFPFEGYGVRAWRLVEGDMTVRVYLDRLEERSPFERISESTNDSCWLHYRFPAAAKRCQYFEALFARMAVPRGHPHPLN